MAILASPPAISVKPIKAKAPDKTASRSAHKIQKGKASFYGAQFFGKTMASGDRMNPRSNAAASKTLPLGSKAKVTNLANGKSAVVEIKDRGPYVEGRIIDLSPTTADKLDATEKGVVPVTVTPVDIPKTAQARATRDAK